MAVLSMAVIIPSAFAATTVPVTQPSNGFIQAPNPEWTAAHQTATSNVSGHREYHRTAEATLLQWYTNHAIERGTAAYNMARRVMLQARNMLHRQFHLSMVDMNNNSSQSSASSRSSVRSSSSKMSSSLWSSSQSSSSVSSSSSSSAGSSISSASSAN